MLYSFDLLVPTTEERRAKFDRMMASAKDRARDPDRVAVTKYIDGETGPHRLLGDTWNWLYGHTRGDVIMLLGDDMTFESDGWDREVEDAFQSKDDPFWLVYGDDGINGKRLATQPFVTRKACWVMGYFVPPWFPILYVDTWLYELYSPLGRAAYLPGVKTEHHHFCKYPDEMDRTYADRRNEKKAVARWIWEETAALRLAERARLTAEIGAEVPV